MDPLVVLLAIVMTVLTILLVVVGVHVIMILRQLSQTLNHVNRTLEKTDGLVNLFSESVHGFGNTMAGVKTGLKVVETFVLWLKEHQKSEV